MRVLVTGAGGFIGQWLTRDLQGHDVRGVDRHDGDLLHPGAAAALLDAHEPDVVVHLAAQVGRLFGDVNPARTIRSNVEMTALVARACGERGIRLCYASTSEVYGDRGEQVCDESAPLDRLPHNLYGVTKRQGEEVAELYAPHRLLIIRPSMPYGPGHPPGQGRAAMTNILWQAMTGQSIPVHHGAERSWCWIGDLTAGIRLILERGEGTYNVGNDQAPVPIREVAERACRMFDAPLSLIEDVPAPSNQTVVKRLSMNRLRDLGWQPTVDLDEGMARTAQWLGEYAAREAVQAA